MANVSDSSRCPARDHARGDGVKRRRRRLPISLVGAALLMVPVGLAGGTTVASATTPAPATCTGTSGSPGTLAGGTYSSVAVTGVCGVSAGQVMVTGDVSVSSTGALLAAFATNGGGAGTSGLTVGGNVTVASGGTLILGCEASAFPCIDDPNQTSPTLNSPDTVTGSVMATDPLGVIVHDSTIGGDATQSGGGGGVNCTPVGIFITFQSPAYSDYEDNSIGGNLRITGLGSCWLGGLRNKVGGSATYAGNVLADPDASEILTNHIAGNLLCTGNSPVIHFGDSGGQPNVVGGFGTGECAFGVTQPNPPAHPPAPAGPLTPISVPSSTPNGYWLAAMDGGVFSYGVPFLGAGAGMGQTLTPPVVGIAAAPGGISYSLAGASGAAYGHGSQSGSCTGTSGTLNKPVVGSAAAPGGDGCWLTAADGGVFASGLNAPFYGSAGGLSLNQPIVGIAATPNGDGYFLAAADGGVFAYGPGAEFQGSMGGVHLNQPIVGIVVDPSTGGYWLIAADGGVFAFNAPFQGSMGGQHLNQPIVGGAAAPTGDGYYLVASDGGIFALGMGAVFRGSAGGLTLNEPIVGMTLG